MHGTLSIRCKQKTHGFGFTLCTLLRLHCYLLWFHRVFMLRCIRCSIWWYLNYLTLEKIKTHLCLSQFILRIVFIFWCPATDPDPQNFEFIYDCLSVFSLRNMHIVFLHSFFDGEHLTCGKSKVSKINKIDFVSHVCYRQRTFNILWQNAKL